MYYSLEPSQIAFIYLDPHTIIQKIKNTDCFMIGIIWVVYYLRSLIDMARMSATQKSTPSPLTHNRQNITGSLVCIQYSYSIMLWSWKWTIARYTPVPSHKFTTSDSTSILSLRGQCLPDLWISDWIIIILAIVVPKQNIFYLGNFDLGLKPSK